MAESDDMGREAMRLSKKIEPLLKGKSREVQGAALCDLLAIWLAGHPPDLRAAVLEGHLLLLPKLITTNEMMLFGPRGHPNRIKGGPQ